MAAVTQVGILQQVDNLRYGVDWEDFDEAPAQEAEEIEELVMDSATAALTIAELEPEIETLRGLVQLAYRVRHDGTNQQVGAVGHAAAG